MVNLAHTSVKEKLPLRSFVVNVEKLTFTVRVRADEVNDAVVNVVVRKLADATFTGPLSIGLDDTP